LDRGVFILIFFFFPVSTAIYCNLTSFDSSESLSERQECKISFSAIGFLMINFLVLLCLGTCGIQGTLKGTYSLCPKERTISQIGYFLNGFDVMCLKRNNTSLL